MSYDLPLHVETHGPPPSHDVETFLLLHGYGASSFTWRYWVPTLARRGHVVLVDMKGFGSAPKPDDGQYAPTDQAELVLRLIHQRDLRNVTFVGHSLGGGVALLASLRLMAETPSRLKRMVIVGGAAYRQRLPPFVSLARRPRLSTALLTVLGWKKVVRWVLRTIVHDPKGVSTSQVEGYAHPLRERGAKLALIQSALQIVPEDLDEVTARYPQLTVPALLIWGRQDRVVPLSVGQRLAGALPHCRLVVLNDCGHLPAEERAEESLAALVAFLDDDPTALETEDARGPE